MSAAGRFWVPASLPRPQPRSKAPHWNSAGVHCFMDEVGASKWSPIRRNLGSWQPLDVRLSDGGQS